MVGAWQDDVYRTLQKVYYAHGSGAGKKVKPDAGLVDNADI